ncbi:hypothetical protein EDC04DRAFT_2497584, partial [Pisolithus marmoratus]
KATLIQKIVNTMWFANKHDNGIIFPNHFKPFPYLALALIECCTDKWTTGTQTDITFTIQEYCNIFKSHLNCLQAFKEATKEVGVLPGICNRMYE